MVFCLFECFLLLRTEVSEESTHYVQTDQILDYSGGSISRRSINQCLDQCKVKAGTAWGQSCYGSSKSCLQRLQSELFQCHTHVTSRYLWSAILEVFPTVQSGSSNSSLRLLWLTRVLLLAVKVGQPKGKESDSIVYQQSSFIKGTKHIN